MPFYSLSALAAVSMAAWIYLLLFRGRFWRAEARLPAASPPQSWPAVAVVVPARNEAATIAKAVASLVAQDYRGRWCVVLADDSSDDGTAGLARAAAGAPDRLVTLAVPALPPGWAGKPWALAAGLERAAEVDPEATYALLTDADVALDPGELRRLVAAAEATDLDMVSLMVRLHCGSAWERLLIPAFVFFFQKLYPFPWVNDPNRPTAAAAGGCLLVRRSALARVGGIAVIHDRIIDDCALAVALKPGGPIWLGLAERSHSVRRYDHLADIWRMVARSAYTQLDRSPWLLAGTVLAMGLIYLAPPAALVAGAADGDAVTAALGLFGWSLMAFAYRPTLRFYGEPWWRAFALPAAALLYTAMTVDSARQHWLGAGATWKGRSYPKSTLR